MLFSFISKQTWNFRGVVAISVSNIQRKKSTYEVNEGKNNKNKSIQNHVVILNAVDLRKI